MTPSGSPATLGDGAEDEDHYCRADNPGGDAGQVEPSHVEPKEPRRKPPGKERAEDADDDVADQAVASRSHENACEEARDEPQDYPSEYGHVYPSASRGHLAPLSDPPHLRTGTIRSVAVTLGIDRLQDGLSEAYLGWLHSFLECHQVPAEAGEKLFHLYEQLVTGLYPLLEVLSH
jgi:hypothetical protein